MPGRRRRKDARPEELLDAALSLFAQKGFAATRSEEVARLAGVSKGTLYLYYPSKEELLRAVIRQRLSAQITQIAGELSHHPGSAGRQLLEILPVWWGRLYDSPTAAVFKVVMTEVRNFPGLAEYYMREVVAPGHRLVAQVIERGMAEGEFRRVDVRAASLSLILPLVMICVQKHAEHACMPAAAGIEPHDFMRLHVEFVVHGLRAGGPRDGGNAAAAS